MDKCCSAVLLLEPCCKDESWIAAFLAYVVQFGGTSRGTAGGTLLGRVCGLN
jgi:hypothetical protein